MPPVQNTMAPETPSFHERSLGDAVGPRLDRRELRAGHSVRPVALPTSHKSCAEHTGARRISPIRRVVRAARVADEWRTSGGRVADEPP